MKKTFRAECNNTDEPQLLSRSHQVVLITVGRACNADSGVTFSSQVIIVTATV